MSCHSYIFFDAKPDARSASKAESEKGKRDFIACIEKCDNVRTDAYATLALKKNTAFMLRFHSETPDLVQLLVRDLLHTSFGEHLHITQTFMGLTRASQYNPKHPPKESAPDVSHRYLIVYPFTKTIAWHLLPFEERRNIMKAHVDVGRKYSGTISQLLLYSFGIDDQEFIVSYQMNALEDFQTLVMELRGTESRRHTEKDTPIFTCIHMPISEALDMA